MLKLIVYKKKACIYLVGGTKEAVITLDKTENVYQIFSELTFTLNHHFWDIYEGFYHKGKFYSTTDKRETAKLIEKLIKGEN
jgi:hypothetical protein